MNESEAFCISSIVDMPQHLEIYFLELKTKNDNDSY